VSCPGSTRATGGGVRFQGNAADGSVALLDSFPDTSPPTSWQGRWIVKIAIGTGVQVTTFAYVICS
jgi:hypothetical protein